MTTVPWEEAWHRALYGPDGFYRAAGGPASHFATATHGATGAVLARAFADLARSRGLSQVVDVGAGRGELLGHLNATAPDLRLTGVDVVDRPADLPEHVTWLVAAGGAQLPAQLAGLRSVLVVAHEWLDVVPCPVAEVDADGVLRYRTVDAAGCESWGDVVEQADRAWVDEHWPASLPGERVEIGRPRDRAWSELVARIDDGLAVAVDYGHRRGSRPSRGTLTAYRAGHQVEPVPDGTCDLTAHVAMDTLDHDELVDQRTALRRLGLSGARPPRELALRDPAGYLVALSEAGAAAALMAAGGYGDFLWAFRSVG